MKIFRKIFICTIISLLLFSLVQGALPTTVANANGNTVVTEPSVSTTNEPIPDVEQVSEGAVTSEENSLEKQRQKYGTGLLLDNIEPVLSRTLLRNAYTPASVDLSRDKYFPKIGDQGSIGSCNAFASTYYHYTYEASKLNNIDVKNNPGLGYSPKWTYNYINMGQNIGSYPSDAYNLLKNHGAATLADVPYIGDASNSKNYLEWPNNKEIMRKALSTRISSWSKLCFADSKTETPITSFDDPDLDVLKQSLNNKHPFTISSYTGWITVMTDKGEAAIATDSEAGFSGNHAMCVVGYDDSISYDLNGNGFIEPFEKGAFKVANSWDTNFANGGFIWFMYDSLNKKSNVPNLNFPSRMPCLIDYVYYTIEVANYTPQVIAEVTLNHADRSDLRISYGEWDELSQSEQNVKYATFFENQLNPLSFNGSSPANQDIDLLFDIYDRDIPDLQNKNWFVQVNDKKLNQNSASVKSVSIFKKGQLVFQQTPFDSVNGSGKIYSNTIINEIPITTIQATESQISLETGESKQIKLNISPNNANQSLIWEAGKPDIVTVDQNGVVTAKGSGKASVYGHTKDWSKQVYIDVVVNKSKLATSVNLNKQTTSLSVGQEDTLIATLTPSNTTDSLFWYSDNPSLVSVDANGHITALQSGKTSIRAEAKNGTVRATCQVTVAGPAVPIQSISLKGNYSTSNFEKLQIGESDTLQVIVTPSNASMNTLKWVSTVPTIASVDQTGKVTMKADGRGVIYAYATDGSGTYAVYYVYTGDISSTSLKLNKKTAELAVGQSETFTPTILPSNVSKKTVSWVVSGYNEIGSLEEGFDISCAKVDENGTVTAKAPGTITLKCITNEGSKRQATCQITVTGTTVALNSLSLKTATTIGVGGTEALQPIFNPIDTTYKSVLWKSSDTQVATVDINGVVQGLKPGTAVITVQNNTQTKSSTCLVTVTNTNIPVTSIVVSPKTILTTVGNSIVLMPKVNPVEASNKKTTWSSSDPNKASVDSSGKVTALAIGTVKITAQTVDGNKTDYATITIKGPNDPIIPVTRIDLNQTNTTLNLGGTASLLPTITPDNATNKGISWTSSNNNVATVDANGKVTAIGIGNATIFGTAKDGSNVTTNCYVTVINKVLVDTLSLNKYNLSKSVGESETLQATISPANATDKAIAWRSSNPEIVTVDANGTITALSAGSAYIFAETKDGSNQYNYCYVTITATVPVTSITLNKNSMNKMIGESETLTTAISPTNATNKTIAWSSNNPDIAFVDTNGKVTAVGTGSTYIFADATDGTGKYAYCYITVTATVAVGSVSLNKYAVYKNVGETETLTTTITPTNATNKMINWTSSNPAIASVDANGKITANSAGSTYVYAIATDGSGQFNYCYISVSDNTPVGSITLNKYSTNKIVGETETIVATVSPTNATNKTINWTSSNSAIATVDVNGKITANAVGSAYIYANATDGSGQYKYCYVTVSANIPVSSIALNKYITNLSVGSTETLTTNIAPSNATNKAIIWTSSNTTIATIDTNGKITAKAAGTVYIFADAADGSGQYNFCYVTVSAKVPVSTVSLNKYSTKLYVGGTETLTTTIAPSNATNKAITWTSSNPTIATVDANGKITAKAAGTANIYANAADGSGQSKSCYITVSAIPVSGVSLTKVSMTLNLGNTETLIANVSPTNATNKTITWSTSNPNIVTVDTSGKITAKAIGTAIITAKTVDGKKSTACTVTVKNSTISVSSVTMDQLVKTIAPGSIFKLNATVQPANATTTAVVWSSSKPAVAVVDANGNVKGIAEGSAIITVKSSNGSKIATCAVYVSSKREIVLKLNNNKSLLNKTVTITTSKNQSGFIPVPRMVGNNIYVPLSVIETVGAATKYDSVNKVYTVLMNGITAKLTIESNTIPKTENGTSATFISAVPPKLIEGSVYIPLQTIKDLFRLQHFVSTSNAGTYINISSYSLTSAEQTNRVTLYQSLVK